MAVINCPMCNIPYESGEGLALKVICDNCTPFRDRKGNPVPIARCALGSRISHTTVGNVEISTVHLGSYAPCSGSCECNKSLFETMIFGGDRDGDRQRWHTVKEAIEGHKQFVGELR